nr:hypothetical protein [Tanacetum cinerariifolium]
NDVADAAKNKVTANEIYAKPTTRSPITATTPPPQQELIPSSSQVKSTPPLSPHQSPTIEITKLKQRVGRLEKKRKLKASGFKRLRKETDEVEPAEVEEVLEVVTATKLMTKVVTTATTPIVAAPVPKASAPRRRRGVIIQDPKEVATASLS